MSTCFGLHEPSSGYVWNYICLKITVPIPGSQRLTCFLHRCCLLSIY